MSVPISPPKKNEWAILVATALLVLLPLVVLGVYVAKKHMWAESMLSQMEPRFARLKGLDLQRDDIDKALARAVRTRSEYIYPAAQDAVQTGNAVQQKVRELLTTAGLTVVSSQVLPPKEDGGFDRISLAVRAEGEMNLFYRVRVVTPGRFVVPPTYAEDMYQPMIYGLAGGGETLTVVDGREH